MENTFPVYSISASAVSNSGNVEVIAINNNSSSSVFITSVRSKKYVSGTSTNSFFVLEGFRGSASTTGGTEITTLAQEYDTNGENLNSSIRLFTGGTTTPSGAPIIGGAFDVGTPSGQQDFKMYQARNGGLTKNIRLNPSNIFVVAKAPGTAALASNMIGATIEFCVTPSSFVEECFVDENPTRDTYSFDTGSYSVTGVNNTIALLNSSTTKIVRINSIRFRERIAGSRNSNSFALEVYMVRNNLVTSGGSIDLTSRQSKFDTNSPDLDTNIQLLQNPTYDGVTLSATLTGIDNSVIAGGAFDTDDLAAQYNPFIYLYRGGSYQKQITIRFQEALVITKALGSIAGTSGAAGGFIIEFTVDTA